MASTTTDEGTLDHAGPAIAPEHFPEYADQQPPITTLYSGALYYGAVILLLSMSTLGLPILAFAHWADGMLSLPLAIAAAAVTIVMFLVGLLTCMYAFRKYGPPEHP